MLQTSFIREHNTTKSYSYKSHWKKYKSCHCMCTDMFITISILSDRFFNWKDHYQLFPLFHLILPSLSVWWTILHSQIWEVMFHVLVHLTMAVPLCNEKHFHHQKIIPSQIAIVQIAQVQQIVMVVLSIQKLQEYLCQLISALSPIAAVEI